MMHGLAMDIAMGLVWPGGGNNLPLKAKNELKVKVPYLVW